MTIRSVDLTYRGRDYRIAEPFRERGASIHRSGAVVACAGCSKQIVMATPRLQEPGAGPRCLICAFAAGLLTEMVAVS